MANIATLAVSVIARTSDFVRKMQTSKRTLYDFQKSAFQMQRTLWRLGQAFAVGFGISKAVREFAEFERQIAKVSTMLNKSGERYLPEYRRAIQSLAVQMGESTETISEGLYKILSAEIPPAKALDVLTASMKAARAGFTDTGTAALTLSGVLNAYKLSMDEVTRVSDILFTAQVKGQTTFGEMAQNLGRLTSIAAPAGIKLEELAAAIATITKAGVPTDQAITGLVQAVTTLQGQAEGSVKAARALGIELSTTALASEGLTGMVKRLSFASAEQLKNIVSERRARLALVPLIDRQAEYLRNLEAATRSGGNTQVAFEKAMDNLGVTLDRTKQSLIFFARSLGATVAPAIEAIANKINDLSLALQKGTKEWWAFRSGAAKALSTITALSPLAVAAGLPQKLAQIAAESWAEANRQMNEFFGGLTGGGIGAVGGAAAQLPAATTTALTEAIAKLQKQVQYFNWSPLEQQIWELNKMAEGMPLEQQKLFNEEFQKFLDLATQLAELQYGEVMAKEAQRIYEATRTPLEKYESQIGRLHELLESGALDWETYGRAIALARKELEGIKGPRLPQMEEIRPSQINIPALSLGLESQKNELQKQTALLEEISSNTREAIEEDIG